uniref:SPARC-like protein 1 n=1 Tax=Coturnix japonica TaxID=93934 RepID=SPRL1_COTJA|nr:RecName: Full=SPARC-like protein 1; AltName: Full=QR1 protein; Flags: Precursor [Coturnix japonica]AAA49499.1 QR1 [Coturnix coturnix]AAA49500.1 QR1 [Coturnix coturnix]
MKTVLLLICLLGSAFTTPTDPLNYQFGAHGQKTAEKHKYTHSEMPEEENTGFVNKGDVLSGHRTIKAEVPVLDTQKDEPWASRRQGQGDGEHQTKNSLRSINFLTLHSNPGLASDNQESNSGSSREQHSSEHHQPRRHRKHGNMAGQWALRGESPVDALGLVRERNTWKYNKNTVGLDENNNGSEEEEAGEEEDEEWGEETDYRDMKHRARGTSHGREYRRWQNENSRPSGEFLRDSSLPVRITKRHGEKFSMEEESQEKLYKEGKLPLSKKNHNEDQGEKRQSEESKEHFQVVNQRKHRAVTKRQDKEGSNAEEDDNDSGDDGEEDLGNVWREAVYEEEERMQSNDQDSITNKQKEEITAGDDSGVYREMQDYKGDKIKDVTHSEDNHYHHEPPNSSSKQQLQTSSSVESMNSTEHEDEVKTTGGSYHEESARNSTGKALPDLCRNFHCKRGKVCQADKQGKPSCICQDPAACPSTKDYKRVCGTDNKTYDGTCQLFGTKCQLEGTKMGRQLHLDYMGACKHIPHCTDYEVNQFPLRMRDWLKNILMQYYERDQDTSAFLTEKQRNKVKKIYLNEKRLVSGEHPVELLLHDFEKNYHMYLYPVHWQFYQLDQHPVDRSLTHSELAPLRASLVPMEHCITRFFQECDGDQDKLITLKEWCHCFAIKEEDINENLLF